MKFSAVVGWMLVALVGVITLSMADSRHEQAKFEEAYGIMLPLRGPTPQERFSLQQTVTDTIQYDQRTVAGAKVQCALDYRDCGSENVVRAEEALEVALTSARYFGFDTTEMLLCASGDLPSDAGHCEDNTVPQ